MRPQAYAVVQRETLSGKAMEQEVFARITSRLAAADKSKPGGVAELANALHENKRLWMLLAIDLSQEGNALPDQLRAQLLSIAAFVERHTRAVIDGEADHSVLVDINQNIINGLDEIEAA